MKILPALSMVLIFLLFFCSDHAFAIDIPVGSESPDFILKSANQETVSLHDFKGSIIVLVYWNPEQPRSVTAIKDLQDIHRRYSEKEVEIVSVTASENDKESIHRITQDNGSNFKILFDPARELYGSYGIRVYPSTVIIDRDGKVAYTIPGHALSYKVKIEGTIRYMLGEIGKEDLDDMLTPKRKKIDEGLVTEHRRYNLAMRFVEHQLYDQAIHMIQQSIKAKPRIARDHILLGFLLIENGEYERAHEEFSSALEIDPQSFDAKTGLGAAHIHIGEIDRAIEILTEALVSNPHPQRTYFELGKAFEIKDEIDKSIDMYKKVIDKIVEKNVLPSAVTKCE